MNSFVSKILVASAAIAAMALASTAMAEDYPVKPIKVTYPYSAGSATEVLCRAITEEASKILGQPMVFENRPGALGRLGINDMMQSEADGYNIAWVSEALVTTQPIADPQFQFSLHDQYEPIALPIRSTHVFVGRKGLPFRNMRELVEYAEENPGKLNFAHAGPGTASHLNAEILINLTGIDAELIPYPGTAPAMTDLLAGQVDVLLMTTGGKQQQDAGELFGLATGGDEPWYVFPDVPTLKEQGIDMTTVNGFGVVAKAGTPKEIIDKLNAAFNAALDSPAVQDQLKVGGYNLEQKTTPEDFASFIEEEWARVEPTIRAINLQLK